MAKLQLKSAQIGTTPGVTIPPVAGLSWSEKLRKSSLILTIILSLASVLILPAIVLADPGGGGAAESPALNIPPPAPTPTASTPTVATPPTGSGDRLSLKKLLGDPNYDFSKLTLADAGKALLTVIDWAIALSGAVALIYIIWGGVQYVTAGGNEEQTKKGKTTITWAIIGLILIIGAYAIVKYFSNTFGTDIPIQ
ncbi:MAG: hypothetical protein AAB647_00980 [Patescibacteria group bacterium]